MDPKRLLKEEIVERCRYFMSLLIQNIDVYVALYRERLGNDLAAVYRDYDTSDLMNEAQRQIILDVLAEKKMTKQRYLDAIYTVLDDPALFEAMVICHTGPMSILIDALEPFDRVHKLNARKDPVFFARHNYVVMMAQLYQKAAALYGFISIEEVAELIDGYEKMEPFPEVEYERESGHYKKTLFADPAHRCIPIMYKHLQAGVPWVLLTLDGLLVSLIFNDDYDKEMEISLADEGGIVDQKTQASYNAFFERLDDMISYRKAYVSVMDKPLNVTAFTTGSGDFAMSDSKNIDELKRYCTDTFKRRITQVEEDDLRQFLIDTLVDQMCEEASDHNARCERNFDRGIEHFEKAVKIFGIEVTKDEILQVAMLLSMAAADQRQWMTRGFSDNEMLQYDTDVDGLMFLDRFGIGGAEAEEVEEVDPESGERFYRIHRGR